MTRPSRSLRRHAAVAGFERRLASPAGKSRLVGLGEDSSAWLRSGLNPRLGGSRVVAAHRERGYANPNVAFGEIGEGNFPYRKLLKNHKTGKFSPLPSYSNHGVRRSRSRDEFPILSKYANHGGVGDIRQLLPQEWQ